MACKKKCYPTEARAREVMRLMQENQPNGLSYIPNDVYWCHGCMGWGRGLALFVYFDEPDLGFCSYQRDLIDPNVTFSRFTVAESNSWSAMPRGKA